MRNLKVKIEFNGSNFCGWQVQNCRKSKPSIQKILEKSLSELFQEKIEVIGCSRTDAGVHAKAYTANFKTKSALPLEKIRLGANALLPEDIAVVGISQADGNFHSRFCAKSKVYRYTILNRKFRGALSNDYVYFCPHKLDCVLMQKEARVLLGRHNFRSFQKTERVQKDPVKTIKKISVRKNSDFVYIDIEADGFLYSMARSIAGTLIEIGRGRLLKGQLKKILESRKRAMAGPNIPAKGLCLIEVKY
ncbi:MAG: tRNA pseudouridine(38-40) synthase TruA [Candidatus Omnitrophica bacterium]|nr:tRNA pseudouridine(38-40) synthase TruA [Candidatus Omnitrophota bacterium]